jgi:hypothetical protein
MATKSNEPAVNPLVEELTKNESLAVPLVGYVGPSEAGVVRLYRDLSLRRYVEIPASEIIRVRQDEKDPEGLCTVLFNSSAKLKFVREATMTADDALLAVSTACSCGAGAAREQDGQDPDDIFSCAEVFCEPILAGCRGGVATRVWCWLEYAWCRLECTGIFDPVVSP